MKYPHHPIADEYPLMSAHDLGRMEQDMCQRGYDARFPIMLFQDKILDGRNRQAAAEKAKVEPCYVEFPGTEDEAREFAQRANEERRHLTREWLDQRRKERIERVTQRRQEGASTRQIAAEEGVTQTQVLRDLKTATETRDVSVEPPDGKVTGRDGKKRDASKPAAPKKQPASKPKEPTDCEGNPLPERLRDVFADGFLEESLRDLKAWHEAGTAAAILSGIRKRYKHLPWLRLTDACEQLEAIDRAFELALETLRQGVPYAVCLACGGEGCDHCRHAGYLAQWAWEAREQ